VIGGPKPIRALFAMTRQSEDSFARRLLDEVGATQPLRARIEAAIGEG
jgi:hypothetical protein